MGIHISDRIRDIPFSSIRQVFDRAASLEKNGMNITHMEIGRPDFDTPQFIKEAAIHALQEGKVHYTSNAGIQELKESISRKLAFDNHINVDPEKGVVVTIGCKEAILNTVLAYINPGDEVLVPDPSWLEYQNIVKLAGGIPVPVPLREEEDFLMNPDDLRTSVTGRTKMIIVNSPQNPTGAVLPESNLKAIAEIANEFDLIVLSDEIYEKLIYDDAKHICLASLPGMDERTIVINGFSKTYAMDGWRLGYAAGKDALIQPILKVHQYNTSCSTSFAQYGAVMAYEGSQESVDSMVKAFDQRRKLIVSRLHQMEGVECVVPKGAFYVFPSFKSLGMSSKELAIALLEKVQIACVPGDAFGNQGQGYLRMAYSTSYDRLEEAMDRLSFFLQKHN
ncbi:pyridoxal phosphate-dependent aminotransferase [Sporolactobacillus laevolacticus]|uniref:pyridoxal phosphate-dependent aminotransferase n=1 Tax=Sporolactobacillus laevolacticus TaxID=33018 RepID=UPI0025B35C87|nr:pyridoxal phosphate-dependent aminotransferase [Sporolactobacillus laevolacticus]MDN3954820.1 pyridoxal phosphate-dependent aminotransferase [Sporolactobacillus laevolacticus]